MTMRMGSENLPDIYPAFRTPCSEHTLKLLYAEFNKLYFGSKLPKDCTIHYGHAATKRHLGLATMLTHFNENVASQTYKIEISRQILCDRKIVVDTLLHEMIHINQYKIYVDLKYDNSTDVLDRKTQKPHFSGHGKHFHKQMDRLNTYGFGVATTGGDDTVTEMAERAYVLAVSTKGKVTTGVALIPKSQHKYTAEEWLDAIQSKTLSAHVTAVDIFSTKTNTVMTIKRMSIKKLKDMRIFYKHSFTDEILEHFSTLKVSSATRDIDNDTRSAVSAINHGAWKRFKYNSFRTYLQSLANLLPGKPIVPMVADRHRLIENIPDELRILAVKEWEEVTIKMIEDDSMMEPIFESFLESAKSDKVEPFISGNVGEVWKSTYEDRTSKAHFANTFLQALASKLKRKYKLSQVESIDTATYLLEEANML
jgi:hypothetical protein